MQFGILLISGHYNKPILILGDIHTNMRSQAVLFFCDPSQRVAVLYLLLICDTSQWVAILYLLLNCDPSQQVAVLYLLLICDPSQWVAILYLLLKWPLSVEFKRN